MLAAPRALDDERVLAALATLKLVADARPAARVPGRLDEQASHMGIADLGDRALPALVARGALGGDEADEGHELLRPLEAREVADLDGKCECGQRVDTAQAAQPADERAPRPLLGALADRLLERTDAVVDEVERVQVGVEGELLGGKREALLGEPAAPGHGPGASRHEPPVAQAELGEAMAVAHAVEARRLAGAHEIAGRLLLG